MAFLGRRPTGSVFLRAREWPGNICAVRSGNGSYYRKTGRTVRRELASSMGEEPSADSRRVRSDERRPYRRANKMDRESSSSNWHDEAGHEKVGPAQSCYNGRRT